MAQIWLSASLRSACPEGVYLCLKPGEPSQWSGILFVREGILCKHFMDSSELTLLDQAHTPLRFSGSMSLFRQPFLRYRHPLLL